MQAPFPPPPRRSNLLLRWGLPLLGLAVLASMWLALAQLLVAERERIAADALVRSQGLARAYAEYTQRKLDQIDQLARFVAHTQQQHGVDEDLNALVRAQISGDPGLRAVSVTDSTGRVIASSLPELPASAADRDYFRVQAASDDDNLYITEVLFARRSQRPLVILSRRINTPDGSFAGVVVVATDPAYFSRFYDATTFGQHGLLSLIGLDAKIRVRRTGDQVEYGGTSLNRFVMEGVATRAEGAARMNGSRFDQRPRYLAYHKLPDYPLLVVAALDESEVLAAHERHRDRLLAVFGVLSVVLLAAFAGLVLLVRRLRHSQAQALAARAHFEAASNASLDAFLILQAVRNARGEIVDFTYMHCNDIAARLLRRDKADILGRTCRVLRGGDGDGDDGDERFTDLCRQVASSRRAAEADLFVLRAPAPAGRWLHHQVVPVGDGVAVTTRDITEARAQTEQVAASREALQQREQMLRAIADNIPALVAHLDQNLRYTFVNAAVSEAYGRADLVGQSMRAVQGEEEYAVVDAHFARALAGEGVSFERTGRATAGTAPRSYQASLIPDVDADGQVRGVYAMGFDVTELIRARAATAAQEKRLRDIADNLPALIAYVDSRECWGFANETYRAWLGLDPLAMVGQPVREVVGEAVYGPRRQYVQRALAGERVAFESEIATPRATRSTQTSYVPDIGPQGQVLGIYTLSVDVTELKQTQRRLSELARVDMLTALPNRLALGEALPRVLSRAGRTGAPLALLFLDIDRFKSINDRFGHAGGDAVLVEFARRLRQAVRSTDTVARLAGDEFVVILEQVSDRDAARAAAAKIGAHIAGVPFLVDDRPLDVSASIGIAWHAASLPTTTAADLLARADAALYGAKAAGRNRFQFEA
ncbi:MAG: diguanylate cyclase [Pseudomonadota bacterium]